jgi:multisubunit Na+/H+ antiporter MnhG subunit
VLAVVLVVLVSVLMITVVAVVAAFPCAFVVTPVPLTVLATAAPAGKTKSANHVKQEDIIRGPRLT